MANEMVAMKKETIDMVEAKIKSFQENGELHFPENYSPQNALKSAWLILQETVDKDRRPALESCSKESIANALLNTVVQGLSPAKKQVYYIAFGGKLQAMRSYFGTLAVTKRLKGVEDIFAQVIYEGDEFEYEINRGSKRVLKHKQAIENIDPQKIVGAYATVIFNGGKEYTELMTKKQIDTAWSKSLSKGAGNVHKEFPEEMAKRTVINRTCKMFVNTCDDSDLIISAFNDTAGGDFDKEDTVKEEVRSKANREYIDVEVSPVQTDKQRDPNPKQNLEVEIVQEGPDF